MVFIFNLIFLFNPHMKICSLILEREKKGGSGREREREKEKH